MSDFALNTTWDDDVESKSQHGDGISRAIPGAKTKRFRVRVSQVGASPMFVELQAESKTHALKYAKARWPMSQLQVV